MASTSGVRARRWVLAAIVGGALSAPALASAEEAAPVDELTAKIVALEASVAQHKKDKDGAGLVKDLDAIVPLHKRASKEAKYEDRLTALIGTILQGTRDDDVEKAALETIGALGDEDNWKYVRKYLAQPDEAVAPPLLLPAIDAAGKIKAAGAVDPLLKIVEDSKEYSAAAAAMQALGSFGENKRARAKILEAMVKTVKRSSPGGRSGKGGGGGKSGGESARWDALAPALVESANRLTGKKIAKPDDWFELYDRHKSKLDDLFASQCLDSEARLRSSFRLGTRG
jgi:hypothetical protein